MLSYKRFDSFTHILNPHTINSPILFIKFNNQIIATISKATRDLPSREKEKKNSSHVRQRSFDWSRPIIDAQGVPHDGSGRRRARIITLAPRLRYGCGVRNYRRQSRVMLARVLHIHIIFMHSCRICV